VLLLDPSLHLDQGEEITVSLQRPFRGDWTWSVSSATATRRQSSFLAGVDNLKRLKKMAPESRPGLNVRGKDSLLVLQLMAAGHNNSDIAAALTDKNPGDFPNTEAAMQFVQKLTVRYGL